MCWFFLWTEDKFHVDMCTAYIAHVPFFIFFLLSAPSSAFSIRYPVVTFVLLREWIMTVQPRPLWGLAKPRAKRSSVHLFLPHYFGLLTEGFEVTSGGNWTVCGNKDGCSARLTRAHGWETPKATIASWHIPMSVHTLMVFLMFVCVCVCHKVVVSGKEPLISSCLRNSVCGTNWIPCCPRTQRIQSRTCCCSGFHILELPCWVALMFYKKLRWRCVSVMEYGVMVDRMVTEGRGSAGGGRAQAHCWQSIWMRNSSGLQRRKTCLPMIYNSYCFFWPDWICSPVQRGTDRRVEENKMDMVCNRKSH